MDQLYTVIIRRLFGDTIEQEFIDQMIDIIASIQKGERALTDEPYSVFAKMIIDEANEIIEPLMETLA